MVKHLQHLAAALWCALCLLPSASAQAPSAPVPIENFYKLPQFYGAGLNPAATHLAYIREVNGRWNLVVMEVSSRQLKNVAGYDNADVVGFAWLDNQRLIYQVADIRIGIGDSDKYAVFAIDRDGSKPYTLNEGFIGQSSGIVGRSRGLPPRANFVSRVRSGESSDFFAIEYAESPFRSTLMRINSRNGARSAVDAGGLTNVVAWALDKNDVARAVVTQEKDRGTTWVRTSADAPWKKIGDYGIFTGEGILPVRFDSAGTLYVAARLGGRDTIAIHRFDWDKGVVEPEPIVSVKDFDIEPDPFRPAIGPGLLFSEEGDRLIGVRYHAETRGAHWLVPQWRELQEMVDKALPGRVNILHGDPQTHVVVRSSSDASPPRFFLLDAKARKLSLLGASMPWIDEKTQARSDFIRYKARDGMNIPALLTLPRGAEGRKMPLVVLVHGGPYVRGIDWEWERDRQFIASRGYAVLEPDFRGSKGHGWKLFSGGFKQWGLAMQDDVADGVKALIDRGIVDKDRVCIAGASYGGYATVMGLIRHPELYKCGVNWVGVTDIDLMYTVGWSDTADSEWARYGMPALVGDREKDRAQLDATSAIKQAARLKAPLLMAYGIEDVRVPYDHGRQLRSALQPHNRDVEYIEYAGEGHGWRLLKTNVDFWTRVEKFLARHIGR